jgi:hypothetical protein
MRSVLFLGFFCAYLLVPTCYVAWVFVKTRDAESTRLLAGQVGTFSLPGGVAALNSHFQDWMDNSLFFRNWIIRNVNYAYWQYLDLSSYPEDVIVGKEGWLFGGGMIFSEFSGKMKFSPEGIGRWIEVMEARRKWLASQGSHFYLILVPTRYYIYPDLLPFWVKKGGQTAIDQVKERLKSGGIRYYDGYERLQREKDSHQVYTLYDIHWTDSGAWFAFEDVANDIKNIFPENVAWPDIEVSGYDYESEYENKWFCGLTRNILKISDMTSCPWETPRLAGGVSYAFSGKDRWKFDGKESYDVRVWPNNTTVTISNNGNHSGIKALVIGNSFTGAISRYLNRYFYKVSYDYIPRVNGDKFKQKVLEERPDIVIYITHYGAIMESIY